MNDIYSDTEKLGLIRLDLLDETGMSYEFHMLIVVQDTKTGRVFYMEDSGCSCPSPFEDYGFESADNNNLNEVTQVNFNNFERAVNNFPVSMEERQACLTTVRRALKDQYKDAI